MVVVRKLKNIFVKKHGNSIVKIVNFTICKLYLISLYFQKENVNGSQCLSQLNYTLPIGLTSSNTRPLYCIQVFPIPAVLFLKQFTCMTYFLYPTSIFLIVLAHTLSLLLRSYSTAVTLDHCSL